MKKVLLITGLLTILFFTTNSSAQVEELWGSSQYGGDSIGNIFKINTDGSGSGIVHNFEFYSGSNPLENDLLQINGKFYGTTFDGGNTGCGMIFSFDTLSHTYTSVYEFTAPYGKFPSGLLVKGAGSLFYGVCHGGGSYGMGTLYSFDISSNTITILHNFDMTSTGGGPQGLVLASDGKLYGSTLRGGVSDQGVLYSYDIGSNTFTLLMVFNSTQGYDPYGYLVEANNKIFGYTKGDHPPQDEDGRIFCWNILTSSFSLICTFSNPTLEGQGSCEGMMKASDGKIYGTVRLGGANNNGIIFSIDPVTNTYTNEHDFTASEGYMDYMNHFVEGTPGLLYGQSLYGGTSGTGFYYTYQISTHTLTNIYSMAASAIDGSVVSGYNKFGNKLYTVYKSGGIDNIGTITCTNLSTGIQTKYFDFQNFAEGRRPQTALIKGANNKIYGTTYIGGINGYGTIFSIDLCTKSYTRIFDFDYSPNGRYPVGKLVQANNGKLYGLTQTGAASGFGCLYSVDTATNTFTRLYDFATGNLQMPSSLVYNPNDNKVYGVAMSNATSNPVMFSWNVATSTFTTLVGFAVTGTTTYDDFFKMGPGNKMYCFTETGGTSGGGSIGVYDPIANTYTTLHSFAGDDPKGTPCISPSGIIYGNTFIGGVGGGTIFSYNIGTSTYTTLYTFPASSTLGNQPKGGLYLSASGKLYGTSSQGPFGSIFQFDPATNTYTNLHNFNGHDGADPWMELISVGSAPVVTTSSPIVCPGSSITLTASGGTSYLWEPGGMTGASVTTTISSTTTYSVTITEAGGCTNEGGITVGVMQANAGPDQYLCASGGTAQLVASPSGINMSIFNTLNWVHTYGSSGNDNGPPAVVTDPAGNIYTVGSYSGTITLGTFTLVSSGLSDVYLAKMNSAGTVLWAVTSTSVNTSNDYGTSIKLDNAGNIYICGDGRATAFSGAAAPSYYGGTEDAFAAKFNNSGVCQWITAVGGTSADYAYGIDVDKNSGAVYLTGSYASTGTFGTFSSTATSFDDYYLVKFNGSTGAVTWLKTISGGSGYEYGDDLVIDNSGNIYAIGQGGGASMNFGGYTYTSFGSSDFFIVKYNSAGTVQWVTSAGGSNYATPGGIAMDYNKSIYVTGSFNGTATFGPYSFTSQSGTDDFFAAKYNSAGAIQWIKTGTGPGNDEGMDVAVSPTGSTVLFSTNVGNNCNFGPGYLCTFPSASYSTCLISTDTLGNYQWMYNNFSNNIVSYANFDNTGSYIYGGGSFSGTGNVGSTTITPVGGQDALYYKLGLASPITYAWTPATGLNSTIIPNPISTPTVTTTYTVSISNGSCSVTDQVTVYSSSSSSTSPNTTICYGASTLLNATGGVSYSWSPSTGLNATNIPNPIASPLSTTTYSVVVTSGTCVSNLQTIITVNNPTVNANASSSTICAGQSTTLTGTGCTSYSWQPGSLSGSSVSVNPAGTTTYTVIGTDGTGCHDTTTKIISVNPLPIVSLNLAPIDTECYFGPTVSLIGQSPTGGLFSGSGVSGNTFNPNTAGIGTWNITYTYTDINGCVNSATAPIYVDVCTGIINPTTTTLDVFPVPVNGVLMVNTGTSNESALISIFNDLGEIILSQNVYGGKITIDMSSFANGIYTLKYSSKNSIETKRIIKQ